MMPVTGASTSLVAFSLSISTIGSPCWTGSPAFLSHSTISPVFIDKPHLGMLKIVATMLLLSATGTNFFFGPVVCGSKEKICVGLSHQFLNGADDALRTGNIE